jgi:hypothetical protein
VGFSSTDTGTAWLLLVVAVVVQWLIIWSATRVAFGQALTRRPALVAVTYQTPDGLVLSVSNRGTVAAADLTVRWRGLPDQQTLASTMVLAADERFDTVIAPPTEAGEIRAGVVVVRYVDGTGSMRNEQQVILAPASMPESATLPRHG